jgi:hypothetical protein
VSGVDRARVDARAREDELGLAERLRDRLGHLAAAGVVLADEQHAERLGARVLRVLARAHVDRLHAHVARLVGDALEAPADRDDRLRHLRQDRPAAQRLDNLVVELAQERVDRRLRQDHAARDRRVLAHERLDRVVQHRDREVRHLDEPLAQRRGRALEARQAQDLARDALGVVADALELEVDLDRAVREPQVQAHRLLPHQELEAQPVDLLLFLVDVLVAQDDGVGLLPVALLQRRDAVLERALGERLHLEHLLADALDVALERLLESCRHGTT